MVDVAPVGVTTRARARNLAMAEGGECAGDNGGGGGGAKRRKISSVEETSSSSSSSSSLVDQLRKNQVSPAISGDKNCSEESVPSLCSSNGTGAVANGGGSITKSVVDLEAENVEIESSVTSHQRKRRERTPSSSWSSVTEEEEEEAEEEGLEESNMERQSAVRNRSSNKNMLEMPSQAELEHLFSAIEEESQKRFLDKYNFDIVKEVPLEGQYEWVELKP